MGNNRLDTTERMFYLATGLVLLCVVLLIAVIFIVKSQNNQQVSLLNQSITRNIQLSKDIKKLSEDNKSIATQNQAHIDCIAALLARYTRNQRPITIQDLDKCTTIEPAQTTSRPQSVTAGQGTRPAETPRASPLPSSATTTPQSTPTPSPQSTPPPNPVQQTTTFLQMLVDGLL